MAGTAEQPLHLARPAFLLDLDQGLQLSKVMGVAQRMVHALHREVRLPVVVHDDAGDAIEQAAAPGRDPVEGQPGTRGDVQPLGPPADPQAGLVHVLDRHRFHQVADHLDDAFEGAGRGFGPSARRSPEPGRRRTDPPSTRPDDLRARAGSATGRPPWPRSARHTAPGSVTPPAGKAALDSLPATSPATATMRARCLAMTTRGRGSGRIENLAVAMAGGHLRRRKRRTTVRAGLGIMIGNRVGFGDLAQGPRPRGPSARPACGPTSRAGSRCAAASASPPAACSVHRSWTAACRCWCCSFRPGQWRSSSSRRAAVRQHQIDQFVFRQEGKGFTIHWILESHHPLLVNLET